MKGKVLKASDCKCVKCGGQTAVAFFPVFDIDQETVPKPYCRSCLTTVKLKMIMDISEDKNQ